MRGKKHLDAAHPGSRRVPWGLFASVHSFQWVFLAVFVLIFAAGCEQNKQPPATVQVPEVEVVKTVQKDVPIYSEWIGTTDGLVNAKIRAQVSGYLGKQSYKEGSAVKKDDMLFELDPRIFKAVLAQAEGQLAQAKAKLGKTELDVKRYTPLAKEGAISQQELDDAIQANLGAKAAVQSADAAVLQAGLNLEFTRIASPIDGIAGSATAQIGDLVGPSSTSELTTVSTVDPIKVYFPISEQEYMALVRQVASGERKADAPRKDNLEMNLADGSLYPHKGTFSFADRQVDVKSGTIRVMALFPNPGNVLRPGQFARVRALMETRQGALLVPQRSVSELQGSSLVAVVDAGNKVSLRRVKTGERVDSLWLIEEGLKPGEQVVVEGIQKVREGQQVSPKAVEAESQPGRTAPPKPGTKPASTAPSGKE